MYDASPIEVRPVDRYSPGAAEPQRLEWMSGRSEENRCRCPHGSALIASHIDRSREPRMGSVADKIAKKITMQIRSNVIDLSSYRAGRELANEAGLDTDRVRKLVQQGSDPCHALYVVGQNFASVLAEQISMMSEAKGYARVVGRAEDEYLPSGPPMSPLTPSYFTTWAFFDVQFGASRETMGTTILRVAELTGLPEWILDVVGLMHQSRMGFYVNCGIEGLDGHAEGDNDAGDVPVSCPGRIRWPTR